MDPIPQNWRHRPHFGETILNTVGEHRHKIAAFVVLLGCASSAFGRSATGIFKYSLLTTPLLFGADYLNRRRTGELDQKILDARNAIAAYRGRIERLGQAATGEERAQIVQQLRDGGLAEFFQEAPKTIALLVDLTATRKNFEAWPQLFATQEGERGGNGWREASSGVAQGLLDQLHLDIHPTTIETERELPPLQPTVEVPENVAGRTIALPFDRHQVTELRELVEQEVNRLGEIAARLDQLNGALGELAAIRGNQATARDQGESRHRDLVHLLVGIGPFAFWLVT